MPIALRVHTSQSPDVTSHGYLAIPDTNERAPPNPSQKGWLVLDYPYPEGMEG